MRPTLPSERPPRTAAERRPARLLGLVMVAASTAAALPGAVADGCHAWVAPAPSGSDLNPGTVDRPWATLYHAAEAVPDRGCTVWFRPGLYEGANHLDRRFSTPTVFRSSLPYRAVLESSSVVVDIDGGRNITLQGFELRHAGPAAIGYVVKIDRRDDVWSQDITLRDNILHDSYDNDLLKLHNGVRDATVTGNLFYNQGDREQHIDINSVTDIVVEDNVFYNDFPSSGRVDTGTTKHFVIIKDSNGDEDGLTGSERITLRRNVFLNWQGGLEAFVKVGNDGMPYHEAEAVHISNNLLIGNSPVVADSAFGVRGARDVAFVNNTVVGDLPAQFFAYRAHLKGDNPVNSHIRLINNIWADPTATMGAETRDQPRLASNDPATTTGLLHSHNLYWNGGAPIPPGRAVDPVSRDGYHVIADPLLETDHSDVALPHWNGAVFRSGSLTIRHEFLRLVGRYGAIHGDSPAVDAADPSAAPADDIMGRIRDAADIGAYEVPPAPTSGMDADAVTSGSPRADVVWMVVVPLLVAPGLILYGRDRARLANVSGRNGWTRRGTR